MRGCTVSRYEQFETTPRRLSKNYDLQFANSNIFKENYSIDNAFLKITSISVRIVHR